MFMIQRKDTGQYLSRLAKVGPWWVRGADMAMMFVSLREARVCGWMSGLDYDEFTAVPVNSDMFAEADARMVAAMRAAGEQS